MWLIIDDINSDINLNLKMLKQITVLMMIMVAYTVSIEIIIHC